MLSSSDLERLIAVKRLELEQEKTVLGLSPPSCQENKENAVPSRVKKSVSYGSRVLCERNDVIAEKKEKSEERHQEIEEIPADLERYIRRYLGLPVMLKAGEYSPNNPLIRVDRSPGEAGALRGLGEYERQRHTLRRIRQQQYRDYLDQQAKKKQEAKEQAEKERREREQREREREEREREILLERDRQIPERRASLNNVPVTSTVYCNNKRDTGVQVDGFIHPLSVAVQTDSPEHFRLTPSPTKSKLTEAERELSPRTVLNADESWPRRRSYGDFDERSSTFSKNRERLTSDLRHSYMPSIFDADAIRLRNLQAEKEAAERRQYYQQELKNQILEQQRIREERKNREKMLEEAEMRRLEEQLRMLRSAQDGELGKQLHISHAMNENATGYYKKRTELQKEIDAEKHKIIHVQPIPATRKQDNLKKPSKLPFYYPRIQERSNDICTKKPYSMNVPDNSIFSPNYDVDSYLRRNLNFDKEKILNRVDRENNINIDKCIRPTYTETNPETYTTQDEGISQKIAERQSDAEISERITKFKERLRQRESENIEGKLRQNDVPINSDKTNVKNIEQESKPIFDGRYEPNVKNIEQENKRIFDGGYEQGDTIHINGAKRIENEGIQDIDRIDPSDIDIIPVLKHKPSLGDGSGDNKMSDKMKLVDDKWKVPAVQKNILKSMPNDEGRSVSILTQLGSIRRQLQLEQLKLDKMLSKSD